MIPAIVDQLPSRGIAGLLFVMWWQERHERVRTLRNSDHAQCQAAQVLGVNDRLLDVIRANTEALTALREELRGQRAIEAECFARLNRQLERLDAQWGMTEGA